MSEEIVAEGVGRGIKIPEKIRNQLEEEVAEKLFTSGFNWNKTALANKYKTSNHTITRIITEITEKAKYVDYEAMLILRLEKNRQLLLEELEELRRENKPRSHILRELRETEKQISEERRKAGFSENKETLNIKGENKVEYIVNVLDPRIEKNG